MSNQLDRNKQNVTDLYGMTFNQWKPAKAVRKCVGAAYTQHNPMVADRTDGFIE